MKDYYKILGIPKNATTDQIKTQYRKYALKFHPDKSTDLRAKDKFQLISEAYGILGDPYKRGRYDCMTERSNSRNTFPMTDPFRMFNSFFSNNLFRDITPLTRVGGTTRNGSSSFSSSQSSVIDKNGERKILKSYHENNNGKTNQYKTEYVIDRNGNKHIVKQEGNPNNFVKYKYLK